MASNTFCTVARTAVRSASWAWRGIAAAVTSSEAAVTKRAITGQVLEIKVGTKGDIRGWRLAIPLDSLVDNRHPPLDYLVGRPMARSKTTLLQGTLDLIVLQLLRAEPTNGYDLMLRIQATSREVLSVNAGSLYPALYRLESRGLIRAEWAETAAGRNAKV